jgi:phosphate transport system protein
MERHFEVQLQAVRERLLAMGSLAETMIHKSVRALVDRDAGLVEAVLAHEEEMDLLCIEIDDRCFTLLALQQPMASDLRFLVGCIKINSDLERIADQAVSIALRARSLLAQPELKPLIDIPRMARLAQDMVRRALDAFVRRDPDLARGVIEGDDEVDGLRDQVFRELLTFMMEDAHTIPRALALILISRNLERIADHATNVAEDVIYIVRGEDVRERGDKERRKGLRGGAGPGPPAAPPAR